METKNYNQIRLLAQMSGKSFLELKTYYDCKETATATGMKAAGTGLKPASAAPKVLLPA